MSFYSQKEIDKAKQMDLLTYLQNYEPNELVHVSGDTFSTKSHDSLKISNGKWCWFSRGIGGRTALDYLIKVREYPFTDAVEAILGRAAAVPPVFHKQTVKTQRQLLMPPPSMDSETVIRYLKGRGILPAIIKYCLQNKLLYESADYHSAVFIGYDNTGQPRYGCVRGTSGAYKGDLSGSDKHFSFNIPAEGAADTVHVFEAAIDLLSFASLEVIEGRNWRKDSLLSLAGVYQTKRKDVVPIALQQFLGDHRDIRTLRLHLDNDEVGRGATAGIISGLNGRYQVYDEPPKCGKDVNDQLRIWVGQMRKEEYVR